MKKTLTLLLTLIVLMVAMAGCKQVEKKPNNRILSSLASTPQDMFPGQKFYITNADGDDDGYYIWHVYGCTQEDITDYIEYCKKKGFTRSVWESNDTYGAYTEDGKYWIETGLASDEEGTFIYVCCNVSNDNPTE